MMRDTRSRDGTEPRHLAAALAGALLLVGWLVPGCRSRPVDRPPPVFGDLVWHDEFEGTALDLTKWSHRALGPRRDAVNSRDAVRLDGRGRLVITTSRVDGEWRTGMIGTDGKFERAFGYFECRVKFQDHPGHWSAFWLQSPIMGKYPGDVRRSGAEIDIFEYLARQPRRLQHAVHWDGYGEALKSETHIHRGRRLARGWHVIGLEWTPREYIFYVDGRESWRTSRGVSHAPQYIILSLEVGKWGGDIRRARLPDSVLFDYVRVYRRPPGSSQR